MFLLLENAKANGILDLINTGLVFDHPSTNKIKMNHIKTMLCGHYIGIYRLERIKLFQGDPLVEAYEISVKEPETVSRFFGNFNHKTTQMMREINFQVFKKLLRKKKLKSITIDIDSSWSMSKVIKREQRRVIILKSPVICVTTSSLPSAMN